MARSTRWAIAAALALVPRLVLAAEDAGGPWTALAADESFSAWRDGDHKGWSLVANAKLSSDNNKRLSAADAIGKSPKTLLSGGDSDLYTKEEFQDVEVKFEFLVPKGSNSGVKLNGLYEIQIRDSHGKPVDQLTGDDCGGVYPRGENKPRYHQIGRGVAAKVNASRPAGEWQSLEITFRAPQFDAAGKKTENARFVRVVHNGEVIHEDIELQWPTGAAWDEKEEVARGPLQLQGDHGPVAFRNIQMRPFSSP